MAERERRSSRFDVDRPPAVAVTWLVIMVSVMGCPGTGGYRQCEVDDDCTEICDGYAARAGDPSTDVVALATAECIDLGFGSLVDSPTDEGDATITRACDCTFDDQGVISLYAEGPGDCCFDGKARDCLYAQAEFPGCTLDDAGDAVCSSECEKLVLRRNADASATYDVAVVEQACDATTFMCRCVVSVDDEECFVANDAASPRTSCDAR